MYTSVGLLPSFKKEVLITCPQSMCIMVPIMDKLKLKFYPTMSLVSWGGGVDSFSEMICVGEYET